jgi:PadR family transcriptional regulator PadR
MTAQHPDLSQGTLDLLILRTLALGPQHDWPSPGACSTSRATYRGFSKALYIRRCTGWSVVARSRLAGELEKRTTAPNTTSFQRKAVSNLKMETNSWEKLTAAVARVLGTT